jgi:hypothetical protein
MPQIEIRTEVQNNPVADEVSALIAIVRPISSVSTSSAEAISWLAPFFSTPNIPSHRQVAGELVQRRDFGVLDVIDALTPLAQPQLLITRPIMKPMAPTSQGEMLLDGLISPVPRRRTSESSG